MPISAIGPRDVLAAMRKMEARGALDSVHRVKQVKQVKGCERFLKFTQVTTSQTFLMKSTKARIYSGLFVCDFHSSVPANGPEQ